jgi:DNA-binding NtrC family response regulator
VPLRQYLKAAERQYLAEVLEHYKGSITPAARHAVIDQATLHRKIRLHGLRAGEFRNGREARDGIEEE